MKEEVVRFGRGDSLVGILHSAADVGQAGPRLGVILLNSGILHRVGPARLYVQMARRLAAMGIAVLRVDLSGVGDSEARLDGMPWSDSSVQETLQAMDIFARLEHVSAFVLGGICSGAVASLNAALADQRVVGTMLINTQEQVRVQNWDMMAYCLGKWRWHNLLQLMRHADGLGSLLKIARSNYRWLWRASLARLRAPSRTPDADDPALAQGAEKYATLIERGVDLLLLYSDGDPGLFELDLILGPHLQRLRDHENVSFSTVTATDHLFTSIDKQQEFLRQATDWVSRVADRVGRVMPA